MFQNHLKKETLLINILMMIVMKIIKFLSLVIKNLNFTLLKIKKNFVINFFLLFLI